MNARQATLNFHLLTFSWFLLLLASCGGPAPLTAETTTFRLALTLSEPRFGDRSATLELRDRSGAPLDGATVAILPTMPSDGMASPEVLARPLGNGRYATETGGPLVFTMIGEWQLAVRVTAQGVTETATFLVPIKA